MARKDSYYDEDDDGDDDDNGDAENDEESWLAGGKFGDVSSMNCQRRLD